MNDPVNTPSQPEVFQKFRSVAVFGSADITQSAYEYDQAYRLAAILAATGVRVVNGGGPGVMQAVTDGAESVNGDTLTVTFEPIGAPFFEGKAGANRPDKEIKTKNYPERLLGLLNYSDAYVVLRGGTGTLSEWATIWLMAHIYYGDHKPFVLVGEYWNEILEVIQKYMFIDETELKVFKVVRRVDQVVPALQELEKELLELRTGLKTVERK